MVQGTCPAILRCTKDEKKTSQVVPIRKWPRYAKIQGALSPSSWVSSWHWIVLFSPSFCQGDPGVQRSPTLVGRLCMLPSKPESSVDSWCHGHGHGRVRPTEHGTILEAMAPGRRKQWKGDSGDSVSCGKVNKNINRFQMVSCRPIGQFMYIRLVAKIDGRSSFSQRARSSQLHAMANRFCALGHKASASGSSGPGRYPRTVWTSVNMIEHLWTVNLCLGILQDYKL